MSLAPFRYRLTLPALALFLLALSAAAAAAAAEPSPPRWPLDLPARLLTSNFMEYRGGRYHAGIDLKTREVEGFPAFAVEDGWISRLRATPNGYGRAVYLRGDSGRTYVYAHLSRFSDRIGALVRAAQVRDGQYRVELEPAAGSLRVERGEVVGLTGQSGTAGPHLHFEVRDGAGRPIDPLAAGFPVDDAIAPDIQFVRAVPASAMARLEGAGQSLKLLTEGGRWPRGIAPTLRVSGPVAFSAAIVERSDAAGHKLEPWLIELRVDGQVVYRRANESFDFAENAQQRLEWLECGGLREQWLYRAPAVAVAGREGGEWFRGEEGQGLPVGSHPVQLTATDRRGNTTTLAWTLEVEPADSHPAGPAVGWKREPVAVSIDASSFDQNTLTPFFNVLPEAAGGPEILRWQPGPGSPALAPVDVARSSAGLTTVQRRQASVQGLVAQGTGVKWQAAAWPFDGAPAVDLPPGVLRDQPATLFRWDGGAWTAAGLALDPAAPGGPARFALPRAGYYAAFRDTLAPVIDRGALAATPHPGFGRAVPGVTAPRWTPVAVGVRDRGVGLDAGAIAARWDGRPLIVEPDLIRDRILVEIPDSTRVGDHVLELEVADQAGHRTSRRLSVSCTRAPATKR